MDEDLKDSIESALKIIDFKKNEKNQEEQYNINFKLTRTTYNGDFIEEEFEYNTNVTFSPDSQLWKIEEKLFLEDDLQILKYFFDASKEEIHEGVKQEILSWAKDNIKIEDTVKKRPTSKFGRR